MRRILIIENQLLLGAGIEFLLAENTDLDVIGISPANQASLAGEISRLRPDVVIVDEASHLVCLIDLLDFMKDSPKFQVVVISANHNRVLIYHKHETKLHGATDLVSMFQK